MKKRIYIAVLVLIAGLFVAFLFLKGNVTENSSKNANSETKTNPVIANYVKACDLLTLDEAKSILGNEAAQGSKDEPVQGEDVVVSNCVYTNNAVQVENIRIATVMVRTGISDAGKESNIATFKGGTPSDTQPVVGIGEAAYYTPQAGQLSILKDGNWISVVLSGTDPTKASLEDAKILAQKVLN